MSETPSRSKIIARLREGRYSPIVQILGTSMLPALEEGWRVRVEPVSGTIEAGDIIQLDIGIRPVLHRAIHVFEKAGAPVVFQRGDAGGPLSIVPLSVVTGPRHRNRDSARTGISKQSIVCPFESAIDSIAPGASRAAHQAGPVLSTPSARICLPKSGPSVVSGPKRSGLSALHTPGVESRHRMNP